MLRRMHPDWPESGIEGTLACFETRDDGTVAPWLTLDRHLSVLRGLWEHRPSARFPRIEEPVLFIHAGDGTSGPEGVSQLAVSQCCRNWPTCGSSGSTATTISTPNTPSEWPVSSVLWLAEPTALRRRPTMPRLLTIMGSGETAPTMVKTHRRVMEAVGATGAGDAVLLDTPYGFQENADDISTKAKEYFRASVGHPIEVASWRHADDDTVTRERALAAVADASYVFAGPGSPTYALRQWEGSALPQLLSEKLRSGGAVTFASAAALTLGVATVPVYEVYKVGAEPFWAEGLDLLAEVGLHVALIPHYDNAEGGGHDTRFCYLGERRLSALEPDLPDGVWVLGVDEHTALVIDLDAGTAAVEGNGTVTVRADGASAVFDTGTVLGLDQLRPGSGRPVATGAPDASPAGASAAQPDAGIGVLADAQRLTAAFDTALADRDPDGAVAAVLELEQSIVDWSADTLQSDERDQARAALRRMIVRLGEVAAVGAHDPRSVVAPYVGAVLAGRVAARDAKQYELADQLRDALVDIGLEIRDTPNGTEWLLPEA